SASRSPTSSSESSPHDTPPCSTAPGLAARAHGARQSRRPADGHRPACARNAHVTTSRIRTGLRHPPTCLYTHREAQSPQRGHTTAITTGDGKFVRRLYDGHIAYSLAVTWDGLTEERNPVQSGRYTLRVAPRAAGAGQLARQLSLEILRAKPDTQPWPAGAGLAEGTPLPLPFSSSSGPAVRSLAAGLAAAVAVVVLPSIVSHDASGSTGRFSIA